MAAEHWMADALTALLNGTAHGLAIGMAAALLLRAMRGAGPAARHLVLLTALVAVALAPLAAWWAPTDVAGAALSPTGGAAVAEGAGWGRAALPGAWLAAMLAGIALVSGVRPARVAWRVRACSRSRPLRPGSAPAASRC